MSALKKLEQFNTKINFGVEWGGSIAFVFMMVLTTADVIGAKIFLAPIPGSLDLMMLAQLIAMSFALGASYLANRHVAVEFFVPLLPRLLRRLCAAFIQLLILGLFVTITWRLVVYGADLKAYGEVSPTIRVPLYPFCYATAIAFIPACIVALTKFVQSIVEVVKQ